MVGRVSTKSVLLRLAALWGAVLAAAPEVSSMVVRARSPEVIVEGGIALFTCSYSSDVQMSSRMFGGIYWKFAETTIAKYTPADGLWYNSSWASRLTLNASWQYGGVLSLSDVTLTDSGRYECQISTALGFYNRFMTLTVYVIPDAVTIRSVDGGHGRDSYEDGALLDVIEGRRIVISCSASPPSKPATNLTWGLDLDLDPQSSQPRVEYFPAVVSPSSSSSTSRATRRYSSEIDLALTPREKDDGARISCHGNHPGLNQDLNTAVILNVRVPPNYVRIWDTNHEQNYPNGRVFNATQGQAIRLKCIGSRSRPPANITWRMNGDVISDHVTSSHVRYQSSQNLFDTVSVLTVGNASRGDHGKVISCSATGSEAEISTNVILHVEGPPDPPRITTTSVRLVERKQHLFTCTALNGFPAPLLRWSVDGYTNAATSSSQRLLWRYEVNSELLLTPLRQMNGKRVHCSAVSTRAAGYSQQLEDSIEMHVMFCPVSVRVTCNAAVERETGTMMCETSLGNPAPTVAWTIAGQPASARRSLAIANTTNPQTVEGIRGASTLSELSLILDAADDGSVARCCVVQDEALGCTRDVCDECRVAVNYKPIVQRSKGLVVSSNDQTVSLRCSARGNPAPTIKWYSPWIHAQSGQLNADSQEIVSIIQTQSRDVMNDGDVTQSTLIIDRTQLRGRAVKGVKCIAANTIGESSLAQYFGPVSGIKIMYSDETTRGKLVVEYPRKSAVGNLPAAEALPCVHVDYRLEGKALVQGDTCFNLTSGSNQTVIWVPAGIDPSDVGVRLCYLTEYCTDIISAQAEISSNSNDSNQVAMHAAFGVLACLILIVLVVLFVIKFNRMTFKGSKPDSAQTSQSRCGSRLGRQTAPISAPVAGQRISTLDARRLNQYQYNMSTDNKSIGNATAYQDRVYENPLTSPNHSRLSDAWHYFPAEKVQNPDTAPGRDDEAGYEKIADGVSVRCELPVNGCPLYMDMSSTPTSPISIPSSHGNKETRFSFDGVVPTSRSARPSTGSVSSSVAGNSGLTLSALQNAYNLTGVERPAPAPVSPSNVGDCLFTYGPLLSTGSHGDNPVSPTSVTTTTTDDGYFSITGSRAQDLDLPPNKGADKLNDAVKLYANTPPIIME